MSSINNLFQRLDVLHAQGNSHAFTLQVKNTTTQTFYNLATNPVTLVMKDARGNVVGTPTIIPEGTERVRIDVKESVPQNFMGSLKYTIYFTYNNTIYYLLCGTIDCVDTNHIPVPTGNYVANESNVILNTTIGAVNNIVLEIESGLPGEKGEKGDDGEQGIQGEQGERGADGAANIGLIELNTWVNGDGLETDGIGEGITVVVNKTGSAISIRLLAVGDDVLLQGGATFTVDDNVAFTLYRFGNDIVRV